MTRAESERIANEVARRLIVEAEYAALRDAVRIVCDDIATRQHDGREYDRWFHALDAALAAADECTCTPCVTPGNGGPTPGHCAACCGQSGIEEYDPECSVAEHRELAERQTGTPSTPEATTPEPETMQWENHGDARSNEITAALVIRWIKRNGGEARYVSDVAVEIVASVPRHDYRGPRIVITGPNDSRVIAKPGDIVTMSRMVKCSYSAFGWHVPNVKCAASHHTPAFIVSSPEATT